MGFKIEYTGKRNSVCHIVHQLMLDIIASYVVEVRPPFGDSPWLIINEFLLGFWVRRHVACIFQALTSVTHLVGSSANQKVSSLIPGQDTCLG